jgi:NDP-sugar pyrophosphorylase family protein
MQIVVLAAGLGQRLRPVTATRSKAMVPVLGRPLVERVLAPWVARGVRDVIFVIGSEDREIRTHFDGGSDLGIEPIFAEQRQRRGMAHALAAAARHLDGDFAVTACDSLVPREHVADLLRAHCPGSAVLSLMDVDPGLVSRSAAVELAGSRVRRIIEKPSPEEAPSNTISLPHYILPHQVLEQLDTLIPSPRGEIELQNAIQLLIDDGDRVVGVPTNGRSQVSDPEDLRRLNLDLLSAGEVSTHVGAENLDERAVLRQPLWIDDRARVGRDSEIGPNVYLEAGCCIGDGATVRDSIVLRGVRVQSGARIADAILS